MSYLIQGSATGSAQRFTDGVVVRDLCIDPWQGEVHQAARFDVRDFHQYRGPYFSGWYGPSGIRNGNFALVVPPQLYETRWKGARAWKVISGVTKDSAGAALPGCTVKLFLTADDPGGVYLQDVKLDETVSDGNGNYFLYSPVSSSSYIVAYLGGAPDVTGATANTVTGA